MNIQNTKNAPHNNNVTMTQDVACMKDISRAASHHRHLRNGCLPWSPLLCSDCAAWRSTPKRVNSACTSQRTTITMTPQWQNQNINCNTWHVSQFRFHFIHRIPCPGSVLTFHVHVQSAVSRWLSTYSHATRPLVAQQCCVVLCCAPPVVVSNRDIIVWTTHTDHSHWWQEQWWNG